MKISYAIPVCNELNEVRTLLNFLYEHKQEQDEIVVLYDSVNGSIAVESYLRAQNVDKTRFRWHPYKFEGNFAQMKNKLNNLCTGDYIFQIDADELPTEYMMKLIPQIIETNQVDLIRVPRINTVEGLTEGHIQKWGWQINEKGWVNYPDYQWRIYKNDPRIKWNGEVHEKIIGHATYAHLPMEETELALRHHKQIERQEKQNLLYDTISNI
jgi:hypothetical protein